MSMLSLVDVEISYGQMEVIKKVSIEVNKGELVSVIGPNGAGKSTLIKAIMGLKDIKSGKIMYDGIDITGMPAWERAGLGIGYVPEGRRVFGNLTVEENLKMGCYKVKDNNKNKNNINKVYELFPRLFERKNQLAKTMSGGEQQMLAIGRALVLQPRLLLIDEVSMGLMPIMVNTCFKIIKDLNDSGITVLVVEQNANKVLKIANRGYVIETGHIVIEDTAENLRSNDVVKKAYLGS
jgi:branched-chain amino acid transport system ATP-binding protein